MMIFVSQKVEQAEADDDNEDEDVIEDDLAGGVDEDLQFEEASRLDASMDASHHNILQALVDPVEWKTELERVGPKLRANQQLVTNEWRSHVDQTVTSKGHIEKVLADTQGDLQTMNKYVA
jgi:estrogen-related receptor beta like 1